MDRALASSLLTTLMLLVACVGSGSRGGLDPLVSDPAVLDAAHPPRLDPVRFESEGAALFGFVYVAAGPGPHPTAILLHGLPGNERNLDLAQALRRVGWNVVFFHYRGAWGSEGRFSFRHVLRDVAAVVDIVQRPGFVARHRVDAARLALVGHSLGGLVALTAGHELEAVRCVVSLAGANLGALAEAAARDPRQAGALEETFAAWGGPLGHPDPSTLVEELMAEAERLDPTRHAEALARTPLRHHHLPLVEALAEQPEPQAEHAVLEGADHAFSNKRIELARVVSEWLERACRSEQPD